MGGRGEGGEGWMGGLGSGEWMPTTFVAVAAARAVLVYFGFWRPLGWEGEEGGEGRMGGLGSGEWMPTTFRTVAAARAVSRVFSILAALGMGGRGEREREGWVGWELGSGHCLMH